MCANGLDFDTVLPQEQRSLVPSDFGFHNALRRPDGTLAFFDFEYFGWDDPVKLTADVLLHGLRWALIVLNEFLPDCWRRRVMAGARESWAVAKQKQLARAHEYLSHLAAEELQGVTHGE